MKGFRQAPMASKKDQLRQLQTEFQNLQMAGRVSQMVIQQLLKKNQELSDTLGRTVGQVNELQYKVLAIQEAAKLDTTELNKIANDRRLEDFNDASRNEDKNGNFEVAQIVGEDSTVILTSTTQGEDQGIFRSRIKLSECGVPDLISALQGKEVGATAVVKLNDVEHTVELLGIRNQKPTVQAQPDVTSAEPTTASAESTGNA